MHGCEAQASVKANEGVMNKKKRGEGMTRLIVATLVVLTALTVEMGSTMTGAETTRDIKVKKIDGKAPAEYVASQIGKSWAVVIGIDGYEKAPKLKYAVADAKSVAEALQQRGFDVTTLYDGQATRRGILGGLGDRLVRKVGKDDRVVIFYAGHGETQQAEGGRAMGYLLPVNGEGDALAETAISMGLIRELADALPAKHVLFLVDVCYGGIAGQQFRSLPPVTEAYLKTITRERGRQLISAGGPKEQAMEAPEWGHSVFTYYLLEGLNKGLADLNDDGIIPASELYSYLNERVFSAAHLKGHEQRPELWALAAEKGEFVFFTTAKPSATLAQTGSAPSVDEPASAKEMARMREELGRLKDQLAKAQTDRSVEDMARMRKEIEDLKKKMLEEERSAPSGAGSDEKAWDVVAKVLRSDFETLEVNDLSIGRMATAWKVTDMCGAGILGILGGKVEVPCKRMRVVVRVESHAPLSVSATAEIQEVPPAAVNVGGTTWSKTQRDEALSYDWTKRLAVAIQRVTGSATVSLPPSVSPPVPAPPPFVSVQGAWYGTGQLAGRQYVFQQQGNAVALQEIMNVYGVPQVTAQGQGQIQGNQIVLDYTTAIMAQGRMVGTVSQDGRAMEIDFTDNMGTRGQAILQR
jgi:uncharacterized caspase-like protein